MFDYVNLPSGPVKHLAYGILGPRLMVFPDILRQIPIDISLFNTWFNATNNFPHELTNFLDKQQTNRLGYYHEALWKFYFISNPQFNLIEHNLQVQKEGKTLGAFDFLIFDRGQQNFYHLEVATKYYLQHKFEDKYYWLGPDLKDRFDLKATRILNHQIQLGETPEGQNALKQLGINKYRKVVSISGMLFCRDESFPLTDNLAPEHMRSRHVTIDEFSFSEDEEMWVIVDKKDWLAPISINNHELSSMDKTQLCKNIRDIFSQDPTPLMVASLRINKKRVFVHQEHQRLFVTPNDWALKADQVLRETLSYDCS